MVSIYRVSGAPATNQSTRGESPGPESADSKDLRSVNPEDCIYNLSRVNTEKQGSMYND